MNKESILSFWKEHYTELDCHEKGLDQPTPKEVHSISIKQLDLHILISTHLRYE